MAENNRDVWRYFVSLGATVLVTSGAVAMMMCTILLPHWFHSEDKHPRTDIGLFHECFSEGLNKGCHAFTDNAVWVVISRVLGASSVAVLMITVALLIIFLFSQRRRFLSLAMLATLFDVFIWVSCFLVFMAKFDASSKGYKDGICIDMALIIVAILALAFVLMCAVGYFTRVEVPSLTHHIRSLCCPTTEEDPYGGGIIPTEEGSHLLQPQNPGNQASDEQGVPRSDILQQEPTSNQSDDVDA